MVATFGGYCGQCITQQSVLICIAWFRIIDPLWIKALTQVLSLTPVLIYPHCIRGYIKNHAQEITYKMLLTSTLASPRGVFLPVVFDDIGLRFAWCTCVSHLLIKV